MIPKDAVEEAIKGGWMSATLRVGAFDYKFLQDGFIEFVLGKPDEELAQRDKLTLEEIALDRSFWQALGKALGWGMELGDRDNSVWKYKALWFYELTLMGGNTKAFWDELLKEKPLPK